MESHAKGSTGKRQSFVSSLHHKTLVTVADVVHHKKELKKHWHLRLTKENLVSLCHDCHNKEHKLKISTGPTLSQRMTRGVF